MHGAGTAGGDAAAVFRARQPQLVAQVPQERRILVAVEGAFDAVHHEFDHEGLLFEPGPRGMRERETPATARFRLI